MNKVEYNFNVFCGTDGFWHEFDNLEDAQDMEKQFHEAIKCAAVNGGYNCTFKIGTTWIVLHNVTRFGISGPYTIQESIK